MSRLSLELRNAIVEKKPVFAVAELDIGGTTHGYAGQWVASDTFGMYKAQVIQNGFGAIKQTVTLRDGTLQGTGTSVTIHDMDQVIHKLVEGEYGRSVKGSAARIKIVSPAIDADKYYTAFTGEIDTYKQTKPRVWQFKIKPKDKPIKGVVKTQIISIVDWADAHGDALGNSAPIVLGKHESSGTEAAGMVPTYYVDTTNYKYLISIGIIDALNDAFVDGVSAASTTYSLETPIINGRQYSVVTFTSDQTTSAVITVDVDGLTTSGTTSASVQSNPAEQLKLILTNWVFDAYQSGSFLPATSVQIDVPSFDKAAAFFDIHNITGSRVVKEEQVGALINIWAKNFQVFPYWTHEGKLAVASDNYILDTDEIYFDWPWLTEEHSLNDLKYDYNTSLLKNEITAKFLYSAVDNKTFGAVRVKDTLRGWDVTEAINLDWGLASLV